MRYAKLTLQYFKKHWLSLLAYSVLPAILLTFTAIPTNVFKFFINFTQNDNSTFLSIFNQITQLSWGSFFIHIAVTVFCAIFIAAMTGTIERDMRLGDFSNSNFFKKVNQSFISCFIVLLSYYFFMELFGILTTSFLLLWCRVADGTVALVLSAITVVILVVILCVVYIYFILWYPVMVVTGYKVSNSLSESIRYVKGHFWNLVLSIGIFLLPLFIFAFIGAYFNLRYLFLLNIAAYSFLIAYIPCLVFVAYFDISGTTREDLNKKPFWLRGEENDN